MITNEILKKCMLCNGVNEETEKIFYLGDLDSKVVFVCERPLEDFEKQFDGDFRQIIDLKTNWIVGESSLVVPSYRCETATDKHKATNRCSVYSRMLLAGKSIVYVTEDYCNYAFPKLEFSPGKAIKFNKKIEFLIMGHDLEILFGDKRKMNEYKTIFQRVFNS